MAVTKADVRSVGAASAVVPLLLVLVCVVSSGIPSEGAFVLIIVLHPSILLIGPENACVHSAHPRNHRPRL